MVADQKIHRFPAEGIQAQALENAFHRFQAAFHVTLDGHAFPDVVKQQRKIEQFRVFQRGENVAEPAIQFAARAARRCKFSMVTRECSSTVYRW